MTYLNAGWNLENSYATLPEVFYARMEPASAHSPKLVLFNGKLAEELGLDPSLLEGKEGAEIFSGNDIPEGAMPLAQAYAGHQFGNFTMLGDGRAILLGEQITPAGKRIDIQLKGSGRTPFSRGGDGKAALGPMLREYIISEAMHALGIPTTRSLAVTMSGESVIREEILQGAVLTRAAASHLRVGTFQYAAARKNVDDLRQLADYAIRRHDPQLADTDRPYLSFFRNVMERQASLIAKWQLVGFIHGVMNTDNMAISGETIDYGPCAFMDTYHPGTVFSSIDTQGRYAYGNQPPIAAWNLARFAETLLPLLHEDMEKAVEIAQEQLSGFSDLYKPYWKAGMRAKLGLHHAQEGEEEFFNELLGLMEKYKADYTNTFIALTFDQLSGEELFESEPFAAWKVKWQERLKQQPESEAEVRERMKKSNPAVIPRNHLVEEALETAVEQGDFTKVSELLAVVADPYAHSEGQKKYQQVHKTNIPYQTYCGT